MRYNLPALNCDSQTNYTPTADSFIEPAAVISDYFGGILVRQPHIFLPFTAAPSVEIPNEVHAGQQQKQIGKNAEYTHIHKVCRAEVEKSSHAPHEGVCQIGSVVHLTSSEAS